MNKLDQQVLLLLCGTKLDQSFCGTLLLSLALARAQNGPQILVPGLRFPARAQNHWAGIGPKLPPRSPDFNLFVEFGKVRVHIHPFGEILIGFYTT